jgi:pimeloyl-ACP methyl ester carboxylesterase
MALPHPTSPQPDPRGRLDLLRWKRVVVYRRAAWYAEVGPSDGLPTVFLHGWALAHLAYREALRRLARLGCRVWAPALPGFGGTPELSARHFSFEGYAGWVDGFADAVGIDEPAFVVGHSFGGGVAIRYAHDFPERVRTLVLVNSVGGAAWRGMRSMAERPLWDWGIHFPSDVLPVRQLRRVVPVLLEDALPNAVRNPRALWRVAQLARKADLTPELEELKRRGLPVVVLWGDQDQIIPRASFDALCAALGADGRVVSGSHSWLLADPDAFGEVMTNVVEVAQVARRLERPGGRHPRTLPTLRGARPHDESSGDPP